MNETETKGLQFRALAICDDTDTCQFCGKTDLMRVVAFEAIATGEILYVGTTCAETVKLLVLDEETGLAAPRTAKQIVSMIERRARELELARKLELATWTAIALMDSWRSSEHAGQLVELDIQAFATRESYTAAGRLPPFWVPRSGNRSRWCINLAVGTVHRLERVRTAKVLAIKERRVDQLIEYLAGMKAVTDRRLEFQGVYS